MISVDGTVFIQIVNFIFLIWVLNYILYGPIRNALLQRKEKISGLENTIDTLNRKARKKDDSFAAGIKDARADGLKEKELLITAANDEEKKIIEKINKNAQADMVDMREKIAKNAEAVRNSLQKEIGTFASAISRKILGRAV